MSRTFVVQYSPDAHTNMVYMNPMEVGAPYIAVDRFVYRCAAHPDVAPGSIALNAVHRRQLTKNVYEPIQVSDFIVPMNSFELKVVTLKASWLKNTVDAQPPTNLANIFRTTFEGSVLVNGQILTLNYDGNEVYMIVTNEGRGMLTMNSDVGVEWE